MSAVEIPRSRDGVIAQEAHGTTVLLRLADGSYYALDAVGAFIWGRCDGHNTTADLVTAVVAEFDAPVEVVAEDVRAFIAELSDEDLLATAG